MAFRKFCPFLFVAAFYFCCFAVKLNFAVKTSNLLVVTVASNNTDGYQRFMRSADVYGFKVQVLGLGQPWRGGDVRRYAGGAYKINLFKTFLEQHKDDAEKIILFTDSYDAVLSGPPGDVVKRFKKSAGKILFSAESYCWPDASVAEQYPMVSGPYRYLNSGGYVGYAADLYKLVTLKTVADDGDDQAYFTDVYLDDEMRSKMKIKLDTFCTLFQNLNGAEGEVQIKSFDAAQEDSQVENTIHKTNPLVIHGNGAAKIAINAIGNYIAKSWTTNKGCLACEENKIDVFNGGVPDDVLMSVFIVKPTPFIDQFFDRLTKLTYAKSKIHLRIHNAIPYHARHVREFVERLDSSLGESAAVDDNENEIKTVAAAAAAAPADDNEKKKKSTYKSVKVVDSVQEEKEDAVVVSASDKKKKSADAAADKKAEKKSEKTGALNEAAARAKIMDECKQIKCSYYFSVDSDAQLTNADALQLLIAQNRSILAPMIKRNNGLYANFWGAISNTGYYARSDDYLDIAESRKTGIWNVPYISSVYLIRGDYLTTRDDFGGSMFTTTAPERNGDAGNVMVDFSPTADSDILFCYHARNAGYFMYVTNQHYYGHLMSLETYAAHLTTTVVPDFYQLLDNQLEWENVYIHENYSSQVMNKSQPISMPCPDAYKFPLVSAKYCEDMIAVMEGFGQWSGGSNEDKRLSGGYENVPTRDIHMNQVGFEKQWMFFLREYVRPVQERLYEGYYHDPPSAIMNFVVRYRPDEQPFLRPHHDASTYTINIALNRPNVDYEGGGCRFLRYNCSIVGIERGWTMMHPGRLTHYHEGLYTTNGTRYIQVSFVDP